jgi:hypothetical protein
MKKYAWILCFVLLLSCEGKESQVKSYRIKQDVSNAIDLIDETYLEDDALNDLIILMNEAFSLVDIEYHHSNLQEALLEVLDFNMSYESQEALIERVTKDYFNRWKRSTADYILEKENIFISKMDYEAILDKTSIASAYTLMLAYEKVYFKRLFE